MVLRLKINEKYENVKKHGTVWIQLSFEIEVAYQMYLVSMELESREKLRSAQTENSESFFEPLDVRYFTIGEHKG